DRWEAFQSRYRDELLKRRELCEQLLNDCDEDTLTLLYAAKDEEHNNAVVLKTYLEDLTG
ncbi:MAG: DUF488 domain-containing protein, partial [bacterium]